MKSTITNQSGFTLLEIMVALFIFTAVVVGVATFSAYYFNNYAFSYEENQQIGVAQNSITRLIREIREARIGDDGSWPLIQTDDMVFSFYSDVTNDGRADKVRYFLQGSDLKRGVIEPTSVPVTYPAGNEKITIVASYVDATAGAIFRYYNGNWPSDTVNNPLSAANRILNTRYVTVSIRINVTTNFAAKPFDLTSGVMIRSLKNNL
jgi:prepilin-type N-terminal cleavage/methylation domain-containing protein